MMNPTNSTDTWFTDLEICALSAVVQLPLFVLVKRTTKWKWAKYSGFAMNDMEEGKGMSAKRLTLDISTPVNPTMQDIEIISHQLVHFTQAMPLPTHDSITASNTSAATTVAGPMVAPPPPPAAGGEAAVMPPPAAGMSAVEHAKPELHNPAPSKKARAQRKRQSKDQLL